MFVFSKKEIETTLTLFKERKRYNANSLAHKLGISPRGALGIVQRLEEQELLVGEVLGRATFYDINLSNSIARKALELFLMQEAKHDVKEWLFVFEEVCAQASLVILFGSSTYDKDARDIDVLIVCDRKDFARIRKIINKVNTTLLKPVHPIYQDEKEFAKNLNEPVIINALRFGKVLCGESFLIDVMRRCKTRK